MRLGCSAEVSGPGSLTCGCCARKSIYVVKHMASGETIFDFVRENEGRTDIIASGCVTSSKSMRKKRGIGRQTPRVSIAIKQTALAKLRLGESELKLFSDWNDGRAGTDLNFKFYRQATDKIVGISDKAAAFVCRFF